jgi:glucose dehydrogenase
MPRKRPFGVTLLLWLVLSLSAWGAIRLLGALRWWNVLNEFGAHLRPLYLSITGASWVVVGAALLWSMFSGKPWTRLAILVSVGVWLLGYWIERIFFESPRANLLFALIASLVLFAVAWVCVNNRKTKEFFIRSEEHEQPDENTESA